MLPSGECMGCNLMMSFAQRGASPGHLTTPQFPFMMSLLLSGMSGISSVTTLCSTICFGSQ
eukprot:3325063-Prorocentrum_lima.AAC.1